MERLERMLMVVVRLAYMALYVPGWVVIELVRLAQTRLGLSSGQLVAVLGTCGVFVSLARSVFSGSHERHLFDAAAYAATMIITYLLPDDPAGGKRVRLPATS